MSLLVWLPMTKDLSDQGLGGCTITNDGTTLDNNGKLGKCYNFDGTNDRILVSGLNKPKDISIAFWLKRNATTNTRQFLFTAWSGVSIELTTTNTIFGKVSFSSGEGGSASGGTITADTGWVHVCYTFEDGVGGKMYINGELKASGDTTNSINWSSTTAGYIGNYSNVYLNAKMNDFRIYDRALAPKEIEILSRGLVCHYPLNNNGNGQANLLKNSNFTEGSSGSQGYTFSATWAKQTDCMKITSGSASSGLYTANYDSVTTGDMATFSAYVKADASMTIYIGVDGSGIGNCESFTIGTSWQRISISKAKTTNNANLRVYGSGTFYVRHMKYELGSTVTPWCPNSADSVYSSMGYNSTTEYDVSGYGYNGTKWNYDSTGSIEYSSNTPRYSVSTFINSANVSTNNTTGMRYIYGNCELTTPQYLTVTFWCNPIASYGGSTNNGIFALTNNDIGVGAATDYNTAPMHNRDADIDMCTSTNVHKTMAFTTTANEWHHYAVVYDGRYGKAYKDGIHTATLDMGSNLSLASFKAIVIGYSHAGGVYRKVQAYYSDFRIYATALSATQVAELYNTAVSVANNGTLMGYELVEG